VTRTRCSERASMVILLEVLRVLKVLKVQRLVK
jgi:hypothetical protein